MEISSLNPMIVSSVSEIIVTLFQEMGFEKRHRLTVAEVGNTVDIRMEHPDGFCADVAQVDAVPRDMTCIRVNVENFDEAYTMLTANGFQCMRKAGPIENEYAKCVNMMAPSGYIITLVQLN